MRRHTHNPWPDVDVPRRPRGTAFGAFLGLIGYGIGNYLISTVRGALDEAASSNPTKKSGAGYAEFSEHFEGGEKKPVTDM